MTNEEIYSSLAMPKNWFSNMTPPPVLGSLSPSSAPGKLSLATAGKLPSPAPEKLLPATAGKLPQPAQGSLPQASPSLTTLGSKPPPIPVLESLPPPPVPPSLALGSDSLSSYHPSRLLLSRRSLSRSSTLSSLRQPPRLPSNLAGPLDSWNGRRIRYRVHGL